VNRTTKSGATPVKGYPAHLLLIVGWNGNEVRSERTVAVGAALGSADAQRREAFCDWGTASHFLSHL